MTELLSRIALVSGIVMVATWMAYPLAIGLFGAIRRRPLRRSGAGDIRVSIVIASREDAAAITARIANCLESGIPASRLEIVVARDADATTDVEEALGPTAASVRIVPRRGGTGKAAALNAGVEAATGDVVVFADTWQRFAPGTIRVLAESAMAPGVGAATGIYELSPASGWIVRRYWRYEKWLRRAESRLHSCVGVTGAVYAMRRELWQPLPEGLILDDVFVPMRLALDGWRVVVADGARAFETRRLSPGQEYGRKVRTLTGVLQLCSWLPAVLVPVRNPLWVQFVFHKLLRLLTPYCLLAIAAWCVVALVVAVPGALLVALAALATLAAAWIALATGDRTVALRQTIREAVLLQFAVMVAGVNGIRGRWKVWDA